MERFISSLIELRELLANADPPAVELSASDLAAAWFHIRDLRERPVCERHVSTTRSPSAPARPANRREEQFAASLLMRRALAMPNGEQLRLIDAAVPLDTWIAGETGRIDLLGLFPDGGLAVIVLENRRSGHDCRIALLEGLIATAVAETHGERMVEFLPQAQRRAATRQKPRLVLVGTADFWSGGAASQPLPPLAAAVAAAIGIDIVPMVLRDAELVRPRPGPARPVLRGHAFLASVGTEAIPTTPEHGPSPAQREAAYLDTITRTLWSYRNRRFATHDHYFDHRPVEGRDPPVFQDTYADRNILIPPGANGALISAIKRMIPPGKRHPAFADMRSTQALAQSFFAGLHAVGRLDALEGLLAEDGHLAFFDRSDDTVLRLQHQAGLIDGRVSVIDAFLSGPRTIAVIVAFAARHFARCPRPRASQGTRAGVAEQGARASFADPCQQCLLLPGQPAERCARAAGAVPTWPYAQRIFDLDASPAPPDCQLTRAILASCIREGSAPDPAAGHALVLYDARNPAFQPGGLAEAQWWETVTKLRDPRLLRRVSWQRVAAHLRQFGDLAWLSAGLAEKYGFEPERRHADRSSARARAASRVTISPETNAIAPREPDAARLTDPQIAAYASP